MLWVGSKDNFCKLTVVSDQWNGLNAFYEKKKDNEVNNISIHDTFIIYYLCHYIPTIFGMLNGSCMDVDIIFLMGANSRANLVRVRKKDQSDAFETVRTKLESQWYFKDHCVIYSSFYLQLKPILRNLIIAPALD